MLPAQPLCLCICLICQAGEKAAPAKAETPVARTKIAWGSAQKGLRIGISCSRKTIPADEQPVFTVHLKNTSDKPIRIPSVTTLLSKTHERVTGFLQGPLQPVIKKVSGREPTYSIQLKQGKRPTTFETKLLQPGQTIVFPDTMLSSSSHYRDEASVIYWFLVPKSSYNIQFQFLNENPKLDGKPVWSGTATSGTVRVDVTEPSLAGCKIEASFTIPKSSYFLGEPIYVTFRVVNRGSKRITFFPGGDNRDNITYNRFRFTATGADGAIVKDPYPWSGAGGGPCCNTTLEPGRVYSAKLLLNSYCAFREPGKYTVVGKRHLRLWLPRHSFRIAEECLPVFRIEKPFILTLYKDPAAMEKYLGKLEQRFESDEYTQCGKEAKALALAKSEPALNLLKKLALHSKSDQARSRAVEWLRNYPKEKTEAVFIKAARDKDKWIRRSALGQLLKWNSNGAEELLCKMLTSQDKQERQQAALLCDRYPLPRCFGILMKMGNDEDPIVRRYLSAALAKYKKKEAIPVLLKLLGDPHPDPFIKIWAANSLGDLGRKDGIPVMIELLKEKGSSGNVSSTLEKLTGRKFRHDYDEWHNWWEKEGKRTDGRTVEQQPPLHR